MASVGDGFATLGFGPLTSDLAPNSLAIVVTT